MLDMRLVFLAVRDRIDLRSTPGPRPGDERIPDPGPHSAPRLAAGCARETVGAGLLPGPEAGRRRGPLLPDRTRLDPHRPQPHRRPAPRRPQRLPPPRPGRRRARETAASPRRPQPQRRLRQRHGDRVGATARRRRAEHRPLQPLRAEALVGGPSRNFRPPPSLGWGQ